MVRNTHVVRVHYKHQESHGVQRYNLLAPLHRHPPLTAHSHAVSPAAISLGQRDHGPARLLEGVDVGVHAARSGGAKRTRCHTIGRLGKARARIQNGSTALYAHARVQRSEVGMLHQPLLRKEER